MRFAQAHSVNGVIFNITVQEVPFQLPAVSMFDAQGLPLAVVVVECGLFEDFEPRDLNGSRCSPARHLFQRIERDSAGGIRAKVGHELPPILDCPTTLEGIKARIRERGPDSIPAKARAWLTLMLPPDQVEAMGVGRGIPISALKALDDMRARRDPSVGSRRVRYDREAQRISDERTAASMARGGEAA
jgi:hypothetical protein